MMFNELIRYTEVADLKYIEVLKAAGNPPAEALRLFCHILNSQHIWICRINKQVPEFDRFALHRPDELEGLHRRNVQALGLIVDGADFSEEIVYSTSAGEEFRNNVADILFHLVNHSTYHRAQVASLLKANGIQPPSTDYVILKRLGEI